jgi:hypothetical protein
MLSFFLNPWTMAAGAGLIAAPVIIHLINRMRFRRIKWAAMEFLLKAQKKMRRRKILEQLLLLFLRMFLVFLVGVLFARYMGLDTAGKETRPTIHVVVLDDTPSMADIGQAGEGAGSDAFTEAKKLITDRVLPAASEATTPQHLRIVRLSDLADLVNDDANKEAMLIDAQGIENVKGRLGGEKPSTIHVSLVAGLKKAQELLDKAPADTAKVVHIVSDLRSVDWSEESEGISQVIKELTDTNGAKVHILDVASPARKEDRKTPAFSDNVGIVEFKPKNRVVPKDREVEFDIRVKNFGNTDLKDVTIQFYLNGQGNLISSLRIDTLPAGQEKLVSFQQKFTQTETKEDPLARFNLVTAVLTNIGSDGLAADNIRHTIVEVREKLTVLFVVNSEDKPDDPKGDSFYLRRLFDTKFEAINVVTGGTDALEKHDLRQYSGIYLLNIPELKKGQAEKLERYVRDGGGVGLFLGPKVLPEPYNNLLYRDGAGFFPVPLPTTGPTQELTPEAKDARKSSISKSFSKKILVRDDSVKLHPAISGVYKDEGGKPNKEMERFFFFPEIDQHWPIARLGKWRDDKSVQELYCLPNDRPMKDFEAQAVAAIDAIKAKYGEPKFEKYRATVTPLLTTIRTAASENAPLTDLAGPLDELLVDQVNYGDASEALLREFWAQPELAEAKKLCQSLRDACKFGDPLYFAKRFGNGRIAAMMIPVGDPWSQWPNALGREVWAAVVSEMQKYLSGGGLEENRSVGSPLSIGFELGRYKPAANWIFLSTETPKPGDAPQKLQVIREPKIEAKPYDLTLDTKDGALNLGFNDAKRPGVYIFTLTWLKRNTDPEGAPSEKPENIVEVFNIDAAREGDLHRTSSDEFKSTARGAEVHASDDLNWLESLKQKQTDLSSGRWIYLLILLVLIFEQAMAVRLSYHQQPENLEAFAPSAAAMFSHGTSPRPPVEEEEPEPAEA